MFLKTSIKIIAIFVLAVIFVCCTNADIEDLPPIGDMDTSSSSLVGSGAMRSSSSSSRNVSCMVDETCVVLPQSACEEFGGSQVISCSAFSSSSNIVSYSSSSGFSSSSSSNIVLPSSSSSLVGNVNCRVDTSCAEISYKTCDILGGTVVSLCPVSSSSSRSLSSSSVVVNASSASLTCDAWNVSGLTVNAGRSFTPPVVRCGNATVTTGITWSGTPAAPTWTELQAGTYTNVKATASCSGVSQTANCSGSLTVTAAAVPSSSSLPPPTPSSSATNSFTDSRNGQVYKTVKIGNQTWMARNLNYKTINGGSICYNDQDSYCATYGRLYNWDAAMTACPVGWRLPSDVEWDVLMNSVGGSSTAGKLLKATSGWNSNGNGLDTYSFAALPGGYGYSGGDFYGVGDGGGWWSSTDGSGLAYGRYMDYYDEHVSRSSSVKGRLFSVRCLQD